MIRHAPRAVRAGPRPRRRAARGAGEDATPSSWRASARRGGQPPVGDRRRPRTRRSTPPNKRSTSSPRPSKTFTDRAGVLRRPRPDERMGGRRARHCREPALIPAGRRHHRSNHCGRSRTCLPSSTAGVAGAGGIAACDPHRSAARMSARRQRGRLGRPDAWRGDRRPAPRSPRHSAATTSARTTGRCEGTVAERRNRPHRRRDTAAQIRQDVALKEKAAQENRRRRGARTSTHFLHSKVHQPGTLRLDGRRSSARPTSRPISSPTRSRRRPSSCFRRELAVGRHRYIQFGYWDSLRKGLTAGETAALRPAPHGERLPHPERRASSSSRKHVSLLQLDPYALVELRKTGTCQIDTPRAACSTSTTPATTCAA